MQQVGKPLVWFPFRGEFGSRLMWYVPVLHNAFKTNGRYNIACIEQHQECLYPAASEYYIVPSPEDSNSTGATGAPGDADVYAQIKQHFGASVDYQPWEDIIHHQKCYFEQPIKPCYTHKITADVVLCRRLKTANWGKVWAYWDYVGSQLQAAGLTVYYADTFNTDEIVWVMQHAKVVVSLQTGGLFLAQNAGIRPWVLTAAYIPDKGFPECGVVGAMLVDPTLLSCMDVARVGWDWVPFWDTPEMLINAIINKLR